MIALLVLAGFALFYLGAVVGVAVRGGSLDEAYREGKQAGLREARRVQALADAEFDSWHAEQERSA